MSNLKSKHAFGTVANINSALEQGLIDIYDILFLDGDTEPKIGWVDKNGVCRLAEGKRQVVRIEELPISDGDDNVVYIYNNEAYVWDGTKCVSLSKSTDLTALETQISDLKAQMDTKVDESTIDAKIESAMETVVEF